MLLTETYPFRPIGQAVIVENAGGVKSYRRTGVLQNYVRKNQNNRIYPKKIWEETLKEGSPFHSRMKGRSVLGLLEHPKDGQTRLDYGPALLVTEARLATAKDIRESQDRRDPIPLEEGDIVGTIEFLNTKNGQELKALDEAGVPICVSSRGVGDVREENGAMIVENFQLETWDAVWSPSVIRAVLTRSESLEKTSVADLKKLAEAEEPAKPAPAAAPAQPFDTVGFIMAYEDGSLADQAVIEGFQHLIDTGLAWKLQGHYGRMAERLIQAGHCTAPAAKAAAPSPAPKAKDSGAGPSSSAPAPSNESVVQTPAGPKPKTQPMSKLNEFRQLESQVTTLTCTNVKGLKTSQRASLLNTVTEMSVALDRLVQEDSGLKTVGARLQRRLREFEDNLNTDDAPPAAPPADVPKADPAPAPGASEAPGAEAATSDDVRQAAEILQSSDDPSASELAPKLNALADTLAADEQPEGEPGTEPAPGGPPAADAGGPPAPAGPPSKDPALESKYNRLVKATSNILERYNALKKSNQADGLGLDEDGGASRKVATQLLGEKKALEVKVTTLEADVTKWETAARDLAEKYNKDMIEMGTKYWQTAKPALFEKVKDQLANAKTFEEFTAITAAALKEEEPAAGEPSKDGEPAPAPTEPKKEDPAAPAPEKDKAEPKGESAKPKPTGAPLTEAVHPALMQVRRARQYGVKQGK